MRAPVTSSSRIAERVHLSGPSIRLDPRVHAVRPDIADIALAGRVLAPHYAMPLPHGCRVARVAVRAAASHSARAVSELLLGEDFAVVDVAGGWAWGSCGHDQYVGYVPLDALGDPASPTHRIATQAGLIFADADIKSPVVSRLPMGARVAGVEEDDFLRTEAGFIHRRHVQSLDRPVDDAVAVAERLIGIPYLWGGRSGDGLDCSGLVQLAFAFAGRAVPRDSDQQQVVGEAIPAGAPLRRGDLVFFAGHVGLMTDADTIVHANAHWMAVTREPLADVVVRLRGAHGDPIVARRRP